MQIRCHRLLCEMEAYRDGLGAKDAQIQVKKFSSKHYMSHKRVPEHVEHINYLFRQVYIIAAELGRSNNNISINFENFSKSLLGICSPH
ncbi:hypothetical protein L208DRAFT_1233617 [Tricholoma matsutake]|nr:hypothetical protein L208DRAFT_1233617 [Tricholoma matsutake 945]